MRRRPRRIASVDRVHVDLASVPRRHHVHRVLLASRRTSRRRAAFRVAPAPRRSRCAAGRDRWSPRGRARRPGCRSAVASWSGFTTTVAGPVTSVTSCVRRRRARAAAAFDRGRVDRRLQRADRQREDRTLRARRASRVQRDACPVAARGRSRCGARPRPTLVPSKRRSPSTSAGVGLGRPAVEQALEAVLVVHRPAGARGRAGSSGARCRTPGRTGCRAGPRSIAASAVARRVDSRARAATGRRRTPGRRSSPGSVTARASPRGARRRRRPSPRGARPTTTPSTSTPGSTRLGVHAPFDDGRDRHRGEQHRRPHRPR